MIINKIGKILWRISLLLAPLSPSIFVLNQEFNQKTSLSKSIINESITTKMNSMNFDFDPTPQTVQEAINDIIYDIRSGLNKDDISQNSNITSNDESGYVSYDSMLLSTLELIDLSNFDYSSNEVPEDLSTQSIVEKYISFAEGEAWENYNSYVDAYNPDIYDVRGGEVNDFSMDMFPQDGGGNSGGDNDLGSDTYYFDIEVGDILFYKKPGDILGDIVKHVSMVTVAPSTDEGGDEWTIVEATPGKDVSVETKANKYFEQFLRENEIIVLTARYLENKGEWYWPNFQWVYPTITDAREMAAAITSKKDRPYEFPPYSRTNDEWYCSELIRYATGSVKNFELPFNHWKIIDILDPPTTPLGILLSPKSKVKSVWS